MNFNIFKMGQNNLIRVFTGTNVQVYLLKERLEEMGVSALIKNDFESGITVGLVSGVPSAIDLYIQESDLEDGERIIKELLTTM